jgi:DNA-binding MarR family transcriptional regulator
MVSVPRQAAPEPDPLSPRTADPRTADPRRATRLSADPLTAEPPAAGPPPEPRWLSADERAAWMPFASVLFRLPAALDAQLQRDAGISHFEYMVLASLAQAPARTLRMSELAELASGSLSRLSHVVSRLEMRGWVHRQACPSDGRYTNAILTDEGFRKIAEAAPGHVDAVRAFVIDALTGRQLRQLEDISDCINRRL